MSPQMHVSFYDFHPNVPAKQRYEPGIDYLSYEYDLGIDDTLALVRSLKTDRSAVIVSAPGALLDFYKHGNQLCVEIAAASRFWHGLDLAEQAIREILRLASVGFEHFGEHVPGTIREWDAYSAS